MCGRMNRCGGRAVCQSRAGNCRCRVANCGFEDTAPTATISMADYQPFILVPTTVFDNGDVDCGCGMDW